VEQFQPVIYAVLFVGVLLVVEGVYLLAFGRSHKRENRVNRRLEMLEKGIEPEDVLATLRKEADRQSNAGSIPLVSQLVKLSAQSNMPLSPAVLLLMIFALAGALFVVFTFTTSSGIFVRVVASLALGYFLLFFYLKKKAKKRLDTFEEQLPDAIELIVRSLRVGHPFTATIGIVAREMPDPIGTEFGMLADEATYGMDTAASLTKMADRIGLQDVKFFAVAVNIQSQSGGNLAEILEGLSKVIRSRFKLFRKIKAITAEARWSGWFLSLFPVVALMLVQLVKPDYYERVADHPLFLPGTILTFILLIANIIFMRALVNIKV
jgi:tight adherence protein B